MEQRNALIEGLEILAKGGKVTTKATTYEFSTGGQRIKVKETITKKEVLPDKSAINKLLELQGNGPLEESDPEI